MDLIKFWESKGVKNSGYIATHVERKSRYMMAAKLDNKKSDSLTMQSIRLFCGIPKKMRQTLTVDNSSEFSSSKNWRIKPA
jgi:IS30 family transposase